MLNVSDAQTMLAIAFGINFGLLAKCNMTAYHFGVALDTILICLSTIIFSFTMVKDYWKTWATAIIRFVASIIIFISLGAFTISNRGNFPQWPLGDQATDNLALLPAACLQNNNLFQQLNSSLSDNDRNSLNLGKVTTLRTEEVFFYILVVMFFVGIASHPIRQCCGRKVAQHKGTKRHKGWRTTWILIRCIPIAIAIKCWRDIAVSRTWAAKSGWLNNSGPHHQDAELNAGNIGQVLALITGYWFIMTILALCPPCGKKRGQRQEDHKV
jgi:hypothetical protein